MAELSGIPVETADGAVRGSWREDGLYLSIPVPVDEVGVPELTKRHVDGIRALLLGVSVYCRRAERIAQDLGLDRSY